MNLKTIYNRSLNSIKGVKHKPNIVFLHVPKCGGTSIDTSIRNQYFTLDKSKDARTYKRVDSQKVAYIGAKFHGLNFEKGDPKNNENMNLCLKISTYSLLQNDTKYFSGHFPFDNRMFDMFKDEFSFITILRDPVDKWLSNYYYRSKRKQKIRGKSINHWLIEDSIEEYLNSERGRFHGYDYVKYYGGIREHYDYNSKEAIENAKQNLEKFKVIGFLDNIEKFKSSFFTEFGMNLDIKHRNASRSSKSSELSQDLISKIEEICAPDIEIYKFAQEINSQKKKEI